MHEIETELSDAEMARVRLAAERAGMTVDDYVTHAASAELRKRYVSPSTGGVVVALRQALKRGGCDGR